MKILITAKSKNLLFNEKGSGELTGHAWLRSRLPELVKDTKKIAEICDIFNDAREWAALKLLFLFSYVQIYTSIIPKNFEKMYYIDLFAGSGVNKIDTTSDLLAGSPVIVPMFARQPFDNLFLIERDYERRGCLHKRLSLLQIPNFEVIGLNREQKIDCNSEIDHVLPILSERSTHYLVFIDGYGLEVDWDTIMKLLKRSGDLIIRFPTSEIGRVWGNANRGKEGDIRKIIKFFGNNIKSEIRFKKRGSNLLKTYMDQIQWGGREITKNIKIKGGQGYRYDLIFATRETRGGTPWIKAILHLKRKIEQYTGKAIRRALDICTGRSTGLDFFFPKIKDTQNKKLDAYL